MGVFKPAEISEVGQGWESSETSSFVYIVFLSRAVQLQRLARLDEIQPLQMHKIGRREEDN